MNPPSNRFPWTVAVGLVLLLLTVGLLVLMAGFKSRLARSPGLRSLAPVPAFTLTNQHGIAISRTDLEGNVWVADIIFTRCPGPCWTMTRRMKELQDALPPDSGAKLITLTTDPEFDTPAVLKTYAERIQADAKRWTFLTGPKSEIANLAISGLKLTTIEKSPETRESVNDLFIHSTIFVVVDKRGRLRDVFETTGEGVDWELQKQKILASVRRLERER